MEQIHKLRVNDIIVINNIKYKIIDIQIKKMGKCFCDHYGNNYLITLLNDVNEEINIIFNLKTIEDYTIDL